MTNQQYHSNNNYLSDSDIESLTYSDDDMDISTLSTAENDDLTNYLSTIACYFDHRSKNSNINLICYNCNSEPKMNDIVAFGERHQNKIKNYDVPLCPNCGFNTIVDANKLKKKKMEDVFLSLRMKNLMND